MEKYELTFAEMLLVLFGITLGLGLAIALAVAAVALLITIFG